MSQLAVVHIINNPGHYDEVFAGVVTDFFILKMKTSRIDIRFKSTAENSEFIIQLLEQTFPEAYQGQEMQELAKDLFTHIRSFGYMVDKVHRAWS